MEVAKRRKIRKSLSEWCRFCGYEPAKHHLLLECLEAAGIALSIWTLSGLAQVKNPEASAVKREAEGTGCEAKMEDRA